MAEGIFEGLLGAEEAEEADGLIASGGGGDPLAMAAALQGARQDPKLATSLGGYMERQSALADQQSLLIRLQTEHLHEQRRLTLSHMRWRRFSDRMKAVLQVMTAAVGFAVAAGVIWMAWSASQERGLIIEPFSVPPDMAARGLNGQVVASMVLDRLGEMQAETNSARAPSTFANNWNDEIKVEIPETGVSVGELRRLMVRWLGHQTTVSGEVYRTPAGVAVTARTGTASATPHVGAEADIDKLVAQAAQEVYATTQPYRYAVYLENRLADLNGARRVLEKLARTGDRTDRIWAYAALDLILMRQGDVGEAIQAGSAGIALDPQFNLGWANRGGAYSVIGVDGPAAADAERADETAHRYGPRYMKPAALAYILPSWEGVVAANAGDFRRAIGLDQQILAVPGQEDQFESLAQDQLSLHDLTAARAAMAQQPNDTGSPDVLVPADADRRLRAFEMAVAEDTEEWQAAWKAFSAIDPAKLSGGVRAANRTHTVPLGALARARLGDFDGARALIATTPATCYQCGIARGQIEAAAGDPAGADRAFAEAVRQAPALPFAYAQWGRALLGRGDVGGAVDKLRLAAAAGPNFADPEETWGEALLRRGDASGAAAKFAEAGRDAPRWGRNHLRWGEALLLAGRYSEARTQFETASGMDLSRGDRAALEVFLARTASGPLHR